MTVRPTRLDTDGKEVTWSVFHPAPVRYAFSLSSFVRTLRGAMMRMKDEGSSDMIADSIACLVPWLRGSFSRLISVGWSRRRSEGTVGSSRFSCHVGRSLVTLVSSRHERAPRGGTGRGEGMTRERDRSASAPREPPHRGPVRHFPTLSPPVRPGAR